jgi:hypothetical protein
VKAWESKSTEMGDLKRVLYKEKKADKEDLRNRIADLEHQINLLTAAPQELESQQSKSRNYNSLICIFSNKSEARSD